MCPTVSNSSEIDRPLIGAFKNALLLPCEVSFIFGNKTVALTLIRNQIRNYSFNVHYVIVCPWWSLSDIRLWEPKSQSLNLAPSFVKQVVVGFCITEMES